MHEHSPPERKIEVKMTRFEFRIAINYAIKTIETLAIPQDIKAQIKNALELELQSVEKTPK